MTKKICDICETSEGPFARVDTMVGVHPHEGVPIFKKLDYCPSCLKATSLKTEESLFQLRQRILDLKKTKSTKPDILAG